MPLSPEVLADIVEMAVETATAPLLARISVLEQRSVTPKDGEKGEPGLNGKDADESLIKSLQLEVAGFRAALAAIPPSPTVNASDLADEAARKAQVTLQLRMSELVKAAVLELPVPKDGTSVTVDDVEPLIVARVAAAVAALPAAKDGSSVTIADVQPLITEAIGAATSGLDGLVEKAVSAAVSALPAPKDGTNVTIEDVRPLVVSEVTKAMDAIPKPQDGQSVTIEDVEPVIAKHIAAAVSAIPPPKDGTSVTLDGLRPLVVGEVTKAVEALPKPKDGVGIVGVFVDREGHLIQTMSDGSTKDVGLVVGRDVDMAAVNTLIVKTLESWPKPKDGRDGLGFDDLDAVYDDQGRMSLRFTRGTDVKEFRVPGHVYREVYRPEETYEKGDSVTFGGSQFIAQRSGVLGKPETCDDWRLSVKRGRDGKNARDAAGPTVVRHG